MTIRETKSDEFTGILDYALILNQSLHAYVGMRYPRGAPAEEAWAAVSVLEILEWEGRDWDAMIADLRGRP